MSRHDVDGYTGEATLVVDGTEFVVDVQLRGRFQPVDGLYRWYGRIAADEKLTALTDRRKLTVELRTPEGSATGEISDPDPWGRYRVLGSSTPPFHVPTSLEELETAGRRDPQPAPVPKRQQGSFTNVWR